MRDGDDEWTLDEMSERCLRGESRALTAIFTAIGQKWGMSAAEALTHFYIFLREREDGDERSCEGRWVGRVRAWGRNQATRSAFLKEFGTKRKECDLRDELGFDTIEDARRYLETLAYSRFSASQYIEHLGMRLPVAEARELLINEATARVSTADLGETQRRNLELFMLQLDGWDDPETATLFGLKVASMRTYRSRGKKLLIELLKWNQPRA